jgi:hypothetical protein
VATYIEAGTTNHYKVSYDTTLSLKDGKNRADALLAVCEQDFDLMSDWFAGVTIDRDMPMAVEIRIGRNNSASWGGNRQAPWPIALNPTNGQTLGDVRFLLIAEVTELFMSAQNKGFFAPDQSSEASNGEALSLFLASNFLLINNLPINRTSNVGSWLNGSREDWVNKWENSRLNPLSYGCALLFIYYLNVQLGFDIERIIASAGPTLTVVYRNLTEDLNNPVPDFMTILNNQFPRTNPNGTPRNSQVLGTNPDNPFPLPTPRSLSTKKYIAALPVNQRGLGLRAQLANYSSLKLRQTLNSKRGIALL